VARKVATLRMARMVLVARDFRRKAARGSTRHRTGGHLLAW
jgi:hypothetical protein